MKFRFSGLDLPDSEATATELAVSASGEIVPGVDVPRDASKPFRLTPLTEETMEGTISAFKDTISAVLEEKNT